MDKRLYFSGGGAFGFCEGGAEKLFESEYIKKYKQNLASIENKSEWKKRTDQAAFYTQDGSESSVEDINASISGVCGFNKNSFLITQNVGEMSGIFTKDISEGTEQYLIHSNTQRFYSPDYFKGKDEILVGVESNAYTCDIALFDIKANNLKILTAGDSFDAFPSFCPDGDRFLFCSRGIGRNAQMQFVTYGASSIFSAATDCSEFKEILSDERTDYLMPSQDKDGMLYYIKKPYVQKGVKQGIGFVDIVLAPFRLIHGLFKLMFFLSMQNSKKNRIKYQKSSGANPARYKAHEDKLTLFNEEIDIQKEEARNKDEHNAGFAPKRFELCVRDNNGERVIKKGVLSYCLEGDEIIYTNGRYIIKISKDGSESVLYKGKKIESVKL